jgi:hypothetical protein
MTAWPRTAGSARIAAALVENIAHGLGYGLAGAAAAGAVVE